jgi:uncharacterized RDD family membrane protein YckC
MQTIQIGSLASEPLSAVQEETGAALVHDNPFPGLRPFQPGEEHLFFGRERQVDTMVDKLARTRFLAVVGTSGSGKSSLVNCGLRPALHRGLMAQAGPAWRMVQFRPGGNPIRALAHSLAAEGTLYAGYEGEIPLAEVIETHLRMSSRGLVDVVHKARLPARTNVLVVVDQFEELFRYRRLRGSAGADHFGEGEDATALVNLLLETLAHREAIYVVLTMRSDFLGDCSLFHGLPEAISEGQYLVPRLSREERRAAVAGPVAIGGAEIEPILLTRLVNDVGDNPDQLSILQHALNRTWAHWKFQGGGDRPIALGDYVAIGTMAEALDRHADKAFHELGDERRKKICERVFKALTEHGTDGRGTRRPTTFAELCALSGGTPAEVGGVIDVFRKPSRSFLMPPLPETLDPDTVVDISHESLMRVWRRLRAWTEEEAGSARTYLRIVEGAALHEEGKASLWRDPELQLALDWRERQEPSAAWAQQYDGRFEASMTFLEQSRTVRDEARAEAEFNRQWRSRWQIGIILLSLLILVLGIENFQASIREWIEGNVGNTTPFKAIAAVVAFALTATPAVLMFLIGEHYGKLAFRRYAFEGITRKVAREAEQPAPAAAEKVDATVRWQTAYAPLWRRAVAFLVDTLIFLAIVFTTMVIAAMVENAPEGQEMSDGALFAGYAFGFLLAWLYHVRAVRSPRQATPGMRLAGVFVTDVHGARPTFARITLRHFYKFLAYPYGVGLLMQPFTKRKQALHDLLSGTVVLTRPMGIGKLDAQAQPSEVGERVAIPIVGINPR